MKIFISLCLVISLAYTVSYDEWAKKQNKKYDTYKANQDRAFANGLKKSWKEYKLKQNQTRYKKTKPNKLPSKNKETKKRAADIKNSKTIKIKPIKKRKIKDLLKKDIKLLNKDMLVGISFFGTISQVAYNKKFDFFINDISKNTIAKFWFDFSKKDYKPLIRQFEFHFSNMQLNDWAKYQFVYKMGMKFYSNKNKANLFTWFVLTKLGLDTKIGYNTQQVYLLSGISHKLYQVSYFYINDKRYYVLDPTGRAKNLSNIRTYKTSYSKKLQELSFKIEKPLKFENKILAKKYSFRYYKKTHNVEATLNKNLIDFYHSYPQSDYKVYFDTKVSSLTKDKLFESLRKIIDGKKEVEAVNILLRFVQNSFEYKTDQNHFKYEKVLFPEETLYYRYSDCEDRTILFSYLVKNLLNIDVIGLKYKDHIASAVALSSRIKGDGYKVNGKIYYVADPTFTNANIGETMTKYKNKIPQAIY